MLLDWFTIVAQIINFLILLFLLRRFLYRPILNTMEAREQRIKDLLEQTEQKRREAENERQRYAAKNQEFQDAYEQKQREMEASIDEWRKDALKNARQEVDQTLMDWHKTVEENQAVFIADLNQFAVRQTYNIARRAIGDLAGTDLEAVMVNAFLEKLRNQKLDLDQLSDGAGQEENGSLKLRSAFALPPDLQAHLLSSLQKHFGKNVDLEFEVAPNLIAGIELVVESGFTAAWNLRRYLETLQAELDEQINSYMGERSLAQEQMEA